MVLGRKKVFIFIFALLAIVSTYYVLPLLYPLSILNQTLPRTLSVKELSASNFMNSSLTEEIPDISTEKNIGEQLRASEAINRYFHEEVRALGGPLCVGKNDILIFVADETHENVLRCQLDNKCTTDYRNYSFPSKMVSKANDIPNFFLHGHNWDKNILFWRQNSMTYSSLTETSKSSSLTRLPPPATSIINSTAFLLDNNVGAHQFGHDINMYIPLIVLLEIGKLDFVSHLVDFTFDENQSKRWNSLVLDSLVENVVLKSDLARKNQINGMPSFFLRSPELNSKPLNMTCFANTVASTSPERYFYHSKDAEMFQNAIRRAYPFFTPTMDSCPPKKAIVLYRSGEGAGLRKMLNYDAVEQALLENGIKSYTNVTVSQDTPIMDAIEIFSSAGLIISTHSSQLKLVSFAHPGTIVIEIRTKEMATWFHPSVFSMGPDVMGVHYFTASKHNVSYETCNNHRKGFVYCDIFVNKTELSSDIAEGLKKQGKRCPVWK